MDGTTFIAKSYTANVNQCNFLGLPLTTEILVEIICHGLNNDDSTVSMDKLLIDHLPNFNAQIRIFADCISCRKYIDVSFTQ